MILNKIVEMDRTVADLKLGETGVIKGFEDHILTIKLLEMGFLPGSEIKLNYKAPLGDPISVRVSGYNVSIRLDEAELINLH
jgi:ferrous iron transport protein A